MGALVAAYVAVWLGVTASVARLAARQRHLGERVAALKAQLDQLDQDRAPVREAA